ncbi:MAG: ArnT family glycosyltransferase [Myxococcota bacterium]
MDGPSSPRSDFGPSAPGELQYHHIAISFLAAIAAFFLIEPIFKACLPIYLSYNEGWNASHALRAMNGQNLYDIPNLLAVNNYPPLSFFIVGALGSLLGDNIFAGRMIALLAFFVTAANVSFIVFRICDGAPAAIFSGVFFVAIMAGIYDVYIGINDPQMLGHALMTAGLAVLIGRETRTRNLVLSALFICAGGFVKHNLVSLPIAVAAYLAVWHRRSFRVWIGCMAGFIALGLATTLAAFGLDFIESLNNPRRFTLFRLGRKMLHEPTKLQVPIAAWLIYSISTFFEKYTLLIGIYVVVAAGTAVVFSGGDGVAINVFFDLVIGLSIAIGLTLHRANETLVDRVSRMARLRVMSIVSLALCFGIVIQVPAKAYRMATILPQLYSIRMETAADIEYLEGRDGPVFCESLSLCYWAEKDLEVDAFHARQSFLTGVLDEDVLLDKVRSGYFDAIQLGLWDSSRDDERISSALVTTVKRCYEISRISANGAFFTPASHDCDRVAYPDSPPPGVGSDPRRHSRWRPSEERLSGRQADRSG